MPSDPTGEAAVDNIDRPRTAPPSNFRAKRRGPRPPFDQTLVITTKSTNKKVPVIKKHVGTAPKKLTKGLRRELIKIHKHNPAEAERQLALIGASLKDLRLKG